MNEIYHHSEHNIISRMIRVRCEILELIQHLHIKKIALFLFTGFSFLFFLILNFHIQLRTTYYSTYIEPCIRLARNQNVILLHCLVFNSCEKKVITSHADLPVNNCEINITI